MTKDRHIFFETKKKQQILWQIAGTIPRLHFKLCAHLCRDKANSDWQTGGKGTHTSHLPYLGQQSQVPCSRVLVHLFFTTTIVRHTLHMYTLSFRAGMMFSTWEHLLLSQGAWDWFPYHVTAHSSTSDVCGHSHADSHRYTGTHIDRLTHKHIIKNEIHLFKQI